MKKRNMTSMALLALAVVRVCAVPLSSHEPRALEPTAHAFFPFCIDWHDAKKRCFAEQAAMLKELGYDGVGHISLDKVAERLKTLDDAGLKLYRITTTVDLAQDKLTFDPRFKDVLALAKSRHVQFDLLVGGMKPSEPAGVERAVRVLREMSDLAATPGRSYCSTRTSRTGSSGSKMRSAWPRRSIVPTLA